MSNEIFNCIIHILLLDIAQSCNLLTNVNFVIHSDIFKISQRIPVMYLSSLWLDWCVCLCGVANLQLNHSTDFRNKKPPMIKLLLKIFTICVSVNFNLLVSWITAYYNTVSYCYSRCSCNGICRNCLTGRMCKPSFPLLILFISYIHNMYILEI